MNTGFAVWRCEIEAESTCLNKCPRESTQQLRVKTIPVFGSDPGTLDVKDPYGDNVCNFAANAANTASRP